MGVDHNAYIGPYLRATIEVKKQTIDKCKDHNVPPDAEFCPKCGTSKNDRIRIYDGENAPDYWEGNYSKGEFNDYFYSTSMISAPDIANGKRTYIYLPNRYYKELNIPRIEGEKYSEEEVAFDELDIPEIMRKFNELFKDEIEYIKQWFEVEVKFGYVSYCS